MNYADISLTRVIGLITAVFDGGEVVSGVCVSLTATLVSETLLCVSLTSTRVIKWGLIITRIMEAVSYSGLVYCSRVCWVRFEEDARLAGERSRAFCPSCIAVS